MRDLGSAVPWMVAGGDEVAVGGERHVDHVSCFRL